MTVGVNLADIISLARRTGYSLMKSDVHGSNGLNPKVSYSIYKTYEMPRMLYSLEILNLRKSDLKQLSDFHIVLLRRIQCLPSSTALSAVYFLVSALPLETELHKRRLSLLFFPWRQSFTRGSLVYCFQWCHLEMQRCTSWFQEL